MADGVGRDYYEIMGLERRVEHEEVKRMWRSRVRDIHPDTSEYPDAEERFKKFSEAYSVLSNPGDRAVYDQYLASGFRGRFSEWKVTGHPQGPREMDPIEVIRDLGSRDTDVWTHAATYFFDRFDPERNPVETRMSMISNVINTGFDIYFVPGVRLQREHFNFFHAASIALAYLVGDPEEQVSSTAKNSFTAFMAQHPDDEIPAIPEDAWNNLGIGLTSRHEHARNNSILLVSELTENGFLNLPERLVQLLQELSRRKEEPVMMALAQASLTSIDRPQRLPVETVQEQPPEVDIPAFMRDRRRRQRQ